ncbi:MAG TPA: metalloprotease PmbA [Gammaproteobacteria bacterium]|nr:metalloprotease PmbA [Gammaproteobacteria bacterium]
MLEGWNHPERLKNVVEDVLKEAIRQGASGAEVDIGLNKGFSVTSRMGDVESVEYNQDKIIEMTVYFGKRTGAASLSDLRPDAIQSAVKAACNIARFGDQDECAGLAPKDRLAFDYPELNLSFPWAISVEEAIALTRECEGIALSSDKRIQNSEGASLSTTAGWHAYGNTEGFIGVQAATRHDISCALIAKEGEDMQRDYNYTVSCDPALLESIEWVANTAVQKTIRRLNARQLSTRKVPVIFIAEEARGLLGHFVAAISGGNLYRKSSFLVDHLGKAVFPSHIQLDERPHLMKSLGSASFDDNGVATRPNIFIENGLLRSYCLGVYSARKLGMETTGNAGGVHNLFINTGTKDLSALLKTMDTGLLVTDLMGQGINLVTGDYSRGAAGFWVEGGTIQYPVEEITIAGNLRDIYANLVEVGADVDQRGNIQTGSILIESMTVAGD